MGGGGSKSSSKSYSGSSNPAFTPYAINGINSVQSVFNQNQPNLQHLTDQVTGSVIPGLQRQTDQSGQTAGQANSYFSDVLGGKYLQGNPHLQQMIDATNRDVTNGVNSQFEMAGRYGSDAHGAGLARELSNADNALRYQNYSDEMGRMGQAAQGAQAGNLGNNSQLMAALGLGAELPYTGSTSLANALSGLFSGGTETSKSVQKGPGLLGSILGGAAQIGSAAIMASDRRLKTKIKLLSRDADGLGRYEFAYKKAPDVMLRGVMADEVKELRPQAYVPDWNGSGYDAVNYAAL